MPNWKKVIVSGSNAHLNQVTASGQIAANASGNSLLISDTLRIAQNGSGLRMTNVGAFDNNGSDNFRIFSNNDLIFSTNGDSGTALTLDSSTKDAEFFGDVSGSATSTGSFGKLLGDGSSLSGIVPDLTEVGPNQLIVSNTAGNALTASGIFFRQSDSSIGIGVADTGSIEARLHIVGTGTANTQEVLFKVNNSDDHDRVEFIDELASEAIPSGLLNRVASFGLGIYAGGGPVRLFSGGSGSANQILRAASTGVQVTGSLDVSTTGSFSRVETDTLDVDILDLVSTQTSVSPLRLTANSLNDNVGALRIDGSQPDIYLNQTGTSFTTVTFARGDQPMVGFGKNDSDNLYFFRE